MSYWSGLTFVSSNYLQKKSIVLDLKNGKRYLINQMENLILVNPNSIKTMGALILIVYVTSNHNVEQLHQCFLQDLPKRTIFLSS